MKQIRKIKEHEVLRRWAIGEVYVEYLNATNEDYPQETLRLLHSNDEALQKLGIRRSLKEHHLSLVDCLPSDVSWYLAALELKQSEFDRLKTLPVLDMAMITNHTYKVSYAANHMDQITYLNPRISQIKNAFRSDRDQVQLLGITVLARNFEGPFTIIEGNGRLISLHSLIFLERDYTLSDDYIEVVLGISDEEFEINVQYLD